MSARVLMFQGTGSNVGKSLIVAGLCRILARRGYKVKPFKPLNMSNNAAVTSDGGEIGRAQALQAQACRIPSSVHMNPVLLKPESDTSCQIIVQGKVFNEINGKKNFSFSKTLLPIVMDSYEKVKNDSDFVIVEGAGSSAETNLRINDIANMGFAQCANCPVILIGDIDRGGVIASIVGTHKVLDPRDRHLVKGFLINKFRGDVGLFDGGLKTITSLTSWNSFGIVPFLSEVMKLPGEDSLILDRLQPRENDKLKIVVPLLSRISNFDDFDPLRAEPGVYLEFIPPGYPIPGDADLVIIPGTKATTADLAFLRQNGWDIDIFAHVRRGGRLLGICGGYQMLGLSINDPYGVEGKPSSWPALGLLNVSTVMKESKRLRTLIGKCLLTEKPISGYEIHSGETVNMDLSPLFQLNDGSFDGARSKNGLIEGTYIHGLFTSDQFRRAYLNRIKVQSTPQIFYEQEIETILDSLADHLEKYVEIDSLINTAA